METTIAYPTILDKRRLAGRADLLDLPLYYACKTPICYAVAPDGVLYRYKLVSGQWQVNEAPYLTRDGCIQQYAIFADGKQRPFSRERLVALATLGPPPDGWVAVRKNHEAALSPDNIEYITKSEQRKRLNARGVGRRRVGHTHRDDDGRTSIKIDGDILRIIRVKYSGIVATDGLTAAVNTALREALHMQPSELTASDRISLAVKRRIYDSAAVLAEYGMTVKAIAAELSKKHRRFVHPTTIADGLRSRGILPREKRQRNRDLAEKALTGEYSLGMLSVQYSLDPDEVRKILLRANVKINACQEAAVLRLKDEGLNVQAVGRRVPLPYPTVKALYERG